MKIIVACHKEYWKISDPLYLYVSVGDALRKKTISGMISDGTGDNISGKNRSFCELTALYWAWKNLDEDCLGLCHYRRYFAGKRFGKKNQRILSSEQAKKLIQQVPVILPKPRRYWIETNFSQYVHAHHAEDLETTRKILEEVYPDYLPSYDRIMEKTYGHRFNMLLMRRDIFDAYCTWLFDVLFRLEGQLDISDYSEKDQRVFGYVSERLLDVWLDTNQIDYKEVPVVNLESQHWLKKGTAFLLRKLHGSRSSG